jgi:hypothetical protein
MWDFSPFVDGTQCDLAFSIFAGSSESDHSLGVFSTVSNFSRLVFKYSLTFPPFSNVFIFDFTDLRDQYRIYP